jgi:hypothetical protein
MNEEERATKASRSTVRPSMHLRTFVALSFCASATALTGCGAEPDAVPPSQSLEEALADLPGDFEGRAAALDELHGRFIGDPRLAAAQREFEAENTPGLLRRVEAEDGRFVSFVEVDGGGLVIEGGPRPLTPLTAELGLTQADPAELWRALLPNEPVPTSLVSARETVAPASAESEGSEALEEGISLGSPFVPAASESHGGIGTTREALTENQFIAAGGCAIQPTPTGAVFGEQVPNSPYCAPSRSGDGWVALRSAEVRTRINVFSGGIVNLKISRDGSAVAFVGVQLNWWFNLRYFNNDHKVTRCSGIFTRTCSVSWEPTPSLWRADLLNASGDGYHFSGVWFNQIDSRADTQPW